MLEVLRTATCNAHQALEHDLALLSPPLQPQRFAEVLQGFRAFHRVWEPQVAALIDDEALLAPRRRLALIEQDLAALPAARIPGPAFDLAVIASRSAAWGSLYVLEGSTLGGQVITRALQVAPWAPAGGLAYFNPYGAQTGRMWSGFRRALDAAAPSLDAEATIRGACATFEALRTGLGRPLDRAA